jgi:hypothetical protein
VDGLEGIIKVYKNVVDKIEFDGPTYLNMIIEQTMMISEMEKNSDGD